MRTETQVFSFLCTKMKSIGAVVFELRERIGKQTLNTRPPPSPHPEARVTMLNITLPLANYYSSGYRMSLLTFESNLIKKFD